MNVSPKNLPALIANELALITEAVSPFYSNNGKQKEVEKAIEIAFKAGLDLGQFHFKDNFIRKSLEHVSGSEEHLSVLFYRKNLFTEAGESAFSDAFSLINMNLDFVHNSFKDYFRKTIYKNYDENIKKLTKCVKAECNLDSLAINSEISESVQKQTIENYKGFGGAPLGSFHCVEMCSPWQSTYSVENQGYKVLATLLNPIYSHGFYFATSINDRSLFLSYSDIMKDFLNTPFNSANSNEIMSKISGSSSPLLSLIKQVMSEDEEKQQQEAKQKETTYLTNLIAAFSKKIKPYSEMC